MSPNLYANHTGDTLYITEPEKTLEWQSAYSEGFRTGKKQALRELKHAMKDIERLEAFATATGTFTNQIQHDKT